MFCASKDLRKAFSILCKKLKKTLAEGNIKHEKEISQNKRGKKNITKE